MDESISRLGGSTSTHILPCAGALSTVVPTKCANRGPLSRDSQMAAKPQEHVCGQTALKTHSHPSHRLKQMVLGEGSKYSPLA